MKIIYCYDAYCGWCYGFSSVMKKIYEDYRDKFQFEVLSGGMMLEVPPQRIISMASYIQNAYKNVEERTGVKFGDGFLQHIFHPEESNLVLNSEKSAIALCVLKEYYPEKAIEMASDIQHAINYDGKDITKEDAYLSIVVKCRISEKDFIEKLNNEEFREKAYYEFQLVKQLNVSSFPQVLVQVSDTNFYLIAKGYTEYDELKGRIESVLSQINDSSFTQKNME